MSRSKQNWISHLAILVSVFMMVGCAQTDRAVLEEAQADIDHREYQKAIELIEKETPNHPSRAMKTKLAFAYLGKSGVELLEVAKQMIFIKSFKAIEISESSFEHTCPQVAGQATSIACLPMVRLDHFPESDQPDLQKSLALFQELSPDPKNADPDINLLLAVVHFTAAVKNYDHLVMPPVEFLSSDLSANRDLQIRFASYSMKYLKRSLDSFFEGAGHLRYSYAKIKKFLDEYREKPLFTLGRHPYYYTDHFTAASFAEFVSSGIDAEVKNHDEAILQKERQTFSSFARNLQSALYALHIQLDLNNAAVTEQFQNALAKTRGWFPSRVQIPTDQHIDPSQYLAIHNAPKAIQRILTAAKDSWNQEDARTLMDEIHSAREQELRAEDLVQRWREFWANPEVAAHGLQSRMISDQDLWTTHQELKDGSLWLENNLAIAKQFAERSQQAAADIAFSNHLFGLIRISEEWVHFNLW